MDTVVVDTTGAENLPLKHQLGRTLCGSVAAFGANKLAERAYDAALRAYRAKKSS